MAKTFNLTNPEEYNAYVEKLHKYFQIMYDRKARGYGKDEKYGEYLKNTVILNSLDKNVAKVVNELDPETLEKLTSDIGYSIVTLNSYNQMDKTMNALLSNKTSFFAEIYDEPFYIHMIRFSKNASKYVESLDKFPESWFYKDKFSNNMARVLFLSDYHNGKAATLCLEAIKRHPEQRYEENPNFKDLDTLAKEYMVIYPSCFPADPSLKRKRTGQKEYDKFMKDLNETYNAAISNRESRANSGR